MCDIHTMYRDVQKDVVTAYLMVEAFKRLFAKNQQTVDLMRRTAGDFFSQVHLLLLDGIVLSLTRLTDPAESMGRPNRSLKQLRNLLAKSYPHADFGNIDHLLTEIVKMAVPFRDHRNKRIAHRDLTLTNQLLPGLTLDHVCGTLAMIVAILGKIGTVCGGDIWDNYEDVPSVDGGDADALIWYLKHSSQLEEDFSNA